MTRRGAWAALGWRAWLGCLGLGLALGLSRIDLLALCGAVVVPLVLRERSGRRALRRRLGALLPVLCGLGFAARWNAAAISGKVHAPSSSAAQAALPFGRIALRVLVAALYLTFLTHDLGPAALERALSRLGAPEAFVSLLVTTWRFGQQLTGTLHAAWAACVLRGGLLSLRALSRTVGSVAGVVLVRSIDRSESIATASALRGGSLRQEP